MGEMFSCFKFYSVVNWRIITVQYCDGFCHHNHHESAIGICVSSSSWTSVPPPTPSHPSRLSQSTRFGSLWHIEDSPLLSVLHTVTYIFPCYSLKSSPHCVQTCSLCLHLFVALKIGLSLPSNQILNIL